MREWDELVDVVTTLLSPEGCAWDRQQTLASLQPCLLEEAHEVIEAVDLNEDSKIVEELGDLLHVIVFYGKLGEKEGRFSLPKIIDTVKEKLIRRHPHVFGGEPAHTVEEIKHNWERIKGQEKDKVGRRLLEGIPPTLPSVVRAQKVIGRIDKVAPFPDTFREESLSEEELGERFLSLIITAQKSGLDAESALRKALSLQERRFL